MCVGKLFLKIQLFANIIISRLLANEIKAVYKCYFLMIL